MKKVLSMLLAIVMVIGMLPISVFAEEAMPVISLETDFNVNLEVGDSFTVTGILTNNTLFGAMTLSLTWNEKAVAFTGFDNVSRGALTSEVFPGGDYAKNTVNNEIGKIVAIDEYGYDTNGKMFVANFEIVGEGELNIGLVTERGAQFTYAGVDNQDMAIEFDFSAITGLTVGGKAVGPEIPEGLVELGVSAIATDAGAIVDIEFMDMISPQYGDPYPYYHVSAGIVT